MEQAMFGAGCFWGVQHSFDQLEGVLETYVGYSGGTVEDPGYKDVCYGTTGHAEVVWLRYDPDVISYEELLEHFWSIHDPTTLDRQGPDVGSQYRSVIFYYGQKQQDAAILSKLGHQNRFIDTIVTEILPAGTFWKAEEYHQRYFEKNPGRGCHT